MSQGYTYVRTYAVGTGPQIAPNQSNFKPVGSLTSHLYVNGADTDGNWGTLSMSVALGNVSGIIKLNCRAITGGTDQSHVLVISVRIDAVNLDNISSQ